MFENILGNDKIKEALKNTIINKNASHSYMFIGVEGIGKKLIATEFSKRLLCNNEKIDCNECKSCIEFDSKNHPDFSILEPDGNLIKIDQIRNMQKKIQEKPIISKRKIYIIDDADKMTREAQNCLLKTLEEPPEYISIILIGNNESSFLPTIKSRCMIIHFEPIKSTEIKKYLQTEFGTDSINIQEDMLDIFQGSIGKAIKLKDKWEEYQAYNKMIQNLDKIDILDFLNLAEPLYRAKEEIDEILEYINILLLKKAKGNFLYTNCIAIVENTKKRLKQNANYDMCIDNMLFNMWEEVN